MNQPGQEDQARDNFDSQIRSRTLVVGLLFVVAACVLVSYSDIYASRGGSIDAVMMGATQLPPAALAGLFVLIFGNALLRRIAPGLRLSGAELLVIYFMMACGALLSSFGLAAHLLPHLVAPNYFANNVNQWQEKFYQHIPNWLVPWDTAGPINQQVSTSFYEGMRYGAEVPWNAWAMPLAAWTILAFILFVMMACLTTLFRRQWVDNEKLSFPLVQIPLEVIGQTKKPASSAKLMWLGVLVPVALHTLNGLNQNFPQFPEITVNHWLNQYFVNPPWTGIFYTPLVIALSVVGFAYLLPLDVSFSFWFFLIFFRFQDIVSAVLGYQPKVMSLYPARYHIAYQSAGAFFAITISMLLLARPHLKLIAKRVLGKGAEDIDSNEFMSYRTACIGILVTFLLAVGWFTLAGVDPWIAAIMLLAFLMILLVLTRCVAEVGLLMLQPIFRPMDIYALGVSPATLGAANLPVLALVNGIFFRDPKTMMPVFMDGMKALDATGGSRRRLMWYLFAGIVVAVITAYVTQLTMAYQIGGLSLNRWFYQDSSKMFFDEANMILNTNQPFDWRAPFWFGIGTVVTFFLYYMRTQLWWWPFHPLGFAMGAAWPSIVYWFAFFIGWASKALILRYGGARLYAIARPFFIGLILGEFAMGLLWTLLSALFGLRVPAIPIS